MDVDEDGAHCITSPRRRCKVEASPSHRDMYKRTPKSWKNKFRQVRKFFNCLRQGIKVLILIFLKEVFI